MTVHTLAAREIVEEIRESLSRLETPTYELKSDVEVYWLKAHQALLDHDWERFELWASLAADVAGLIQQKEKPL